jgi:hypothetical protein
MIEFLTKLFKQMTTVIDFASSKDCIIERSSKYFLNYSLPIVLLYISLTSSIID